MALLLPKTRLDPLIFGNSLTHGEGHGCGKASTTANSPSTTFHGSWKARSQTHSHGSRTVRTAGKGQQIYVESDGSYFAIKQEHV